MDKNNYLNRINSDRSELDLYDEEIVINQNFQFGRKL